LSLVVITMKKSDILVYTPLDFVASDSKAVEFAGELSDSLIRAQTTIKQCHYPIKLGLKTTLVSRGQYDTTQTDSSGGSAWGVSEEGRDSFYKGIKKLGDAGIDCYIDTWASGPTRSVCGVLFDSGLIAAGFGAFSTGDLDQFPPEKNLENFLGLYEQVRLRNAVLGVGARNVPIVLACNVENGYLRRIFEGVVNLTVTSVANRFGYNLRTIDREHAPDDAAFNDHGDYVTGVYLFSPDSISRSRLQRELVDLARQEKFSGFEDEYAMVILAAGRGNLVCKYFESHPNPFDAINIEKERTKIIDQQIKKPLVSLRGTFAGISLLGVIDSSIEEASRGRLSEFYTREQLDEVFGYMREALNG